jgi:hypothetical protein
VNVQGSVTCCELTPGAAESELSQLIQAANVCTCKRVPVPCRELCLLQRVATLWIACQTSRCAIITDQGDGDFEVDQSNMDWATVSMHATSCCW